MYSEEKRKKAKKYVRIGKKAKKMWINTPIFTHSEILKVSIFGG